jgi:hypothetical protein
MDTIKAEYEEITQKIKQNRPIKAFPIRELVLMMRDKHPKLTLKSKFLIKDVMNTGDISGILCVIDCEDAQGLACALTHLYIARSEPLRKEIEKYQKKRAKRVDMQYKQARN